MKDETQQDEILSDLQCDQCGYIPTSDWKGQAGSSCPHHWDPNSGCDGILRTQINSKPQES